VAVGEGAVWVSSNDKLLKVNPETNEVAGVVSVGASYSQLVVYGGGVWAMTQGGEHWLVRVDPRTMQVVAAEVIGPYTIEPGLAAGGGYVWFLSGEGLARVSATSWQEQTTEEARCEGSRTIMMEEGGLVTTNDIPGCPNGGLLSGTDKADMLDGSKGDDEIHGLGGVDTIDGGEGNDVIYGGPGDDTSLWGFRGDDVIYGGDGNEEEIDGAGGDNVLYGGDGNDNLGGWGGEQVLYGGDGNDYLGAQDAQGDEDKTPDKLYCGEGRDHYSADKNDYVDSSCEVEGGWVIVD
jgi:Ca2+-binding RTX toxin-like protein